MCYMIAINRFYFNITSNMFHIKFTRMQNLLFQLKSMNFGSQKAIVFTNKFMTMFIFNL